MARYRLKMPIVEARQVPVFADDPSVEKASIIEYVEECINLASWCGGKSHMMHSPGDPGYDHILVPTFAGSMLALPGDWIIKGANSEFMPCRSGIFEKTYEEVKS